jgi:hypothetical protein
MKISLELADTYHSMALGRTFKADALYDVTPEEGEILLQAHNEYGTAYFVAVDGPLPETLEAEEETVVAESAPSPAPAPVKAAPKPVAPKPEAPKPSATQPDDAVTI